MAIGPKRTSKKPVTGGRKSGTWGQRARRGRSGASSVKKGTGKK